jgi:hypothetical protein
MLGWSVLWDTAGYCEYSCRYDFYSPKTNFIFHHYYREGAPKFFELGGGGEAERCSAARPLHRALWNATRRATCNITHHAPSQCNTHRSPCSASEGRLCITDSSKYSAQLRAQRTGTHGAAAALQVGPEDEASHGHAVRRRAHRL